MILFVGEKTKAFFTEEIIPQYNESIIHTGYSAHILEVKEKITEQNYTHIIVDCSQFIDNYTVIANELSNLKKITRANFIILATGYDIGSELIQSLIGKGFRNFCINSILSMQKTELRNCLENRNSILDNITNTEDPSLVDDTQVISNISQKAVTVAFVGASSRIGTTTQAIQYIRYLQFLGKKACYISINDNYIELLRNINGLEYTDEKLKMLTYENIDMFNEVDELSNILKKPYDFFVFDYGNICENNFPFFSFLERDIRICVCGSKSTEIIDTNNLINRMNNNDVFYLFNFTSEEYQSEMLNFMNDKKDKTFFAPYCFDYFLYTSLSNDIYRNFYNVELDENYIKQKRKKDINLKIIKLLINILKGIYRTILYTSIFIIALLLLYMLLVPDGKDYFISLVNQFL